MGNTVRANRYSEEFKQGAIRLVLEKKQSIAEVCAAISACRETHWNAGWR